MDLGCSWKQRWLRQMLVVSVALLFTSISALPAPSQAAAASLVYSDRALSEPPRNPLSFVAGQLHRSGEAGCSWPGCLRTRRCATACANPQPNAVYHQAQRSVSAPQMLSESTTKICLGTTKILYSFTRPCTENTLFRCLACTVG